MNKAIDLYDTIPVPIPALLRVARRTYGWAIRDALQEIGCEDMPHNGIYVVGGIARNGPRLTQLIKEMGVSKQAASQLIDTLVIRGYIERSPDPDDRRRMNVVLTERGKIAAEASRAAVERIDEELTEEVGQENIKNAKYTLAVLIDINDRHHNLPRGVRP